MYTDDKRCSKLQNFRVGSFVRYRKPGVHKSGQSKFSPPQIVVKKMGPSTYKTGDGKVWNQKDLSKVFMPSDVFNDSKVHKNSSPAQRVATPPRRNGRTTRPPSWQKDYIMY